MNRSLRVSAATYLLAFILASCSKEKTEVPGINKEILGMWTESALSPTFSRQLQFRDDWSFSFFVETGNESTLILSGTYAIKNDSLKTYVTKREEKAAGQQRIVKTVESQPLYENCTFQIENQVLSLKYTSYPADAPVETRANFNKVLPID